MLRPRYYVLIYLQRGIRCQQRFNPRDRSDPVISSQGVNSIGKDVEMILLQRLLLRVAELLEKGKRCIFMHCIPITAALAKDHAD